MNCSNTIPTVFLKNENVYKLIDFFERQAENYINNLIIRLNDEGSLGYGTITILILLNRI